jgi:hypothetical protein
MQTCGYIPAYECTPWLFVHCVDRLSPAKGETERGLTAENQHRSQCDQNMAGRQGESPVQRTKGQRPGRTRRSCGQWVTGPGLASLRPGRTPCVLSTFALRSAAPDDDVSVSAQMWSVPRAVQPLTESVSRSNSLFLRNSGRKTGSHFSWNCSNAGPEGLPTRS